MSSPMRLMVLTPGVFPSFEDVKRKLWIFLASCEKAGVPKTDLYFYGVGRGFPGYKAMMLDYQLEYLYLRRHDGYTHVLFTDSWDAFFCASLEEIITKYKAMGAPPILTAAFFQLGNVSDEEAQYPNCFDHSIYYCYPNRGGYIAEYGAIVDAFERMMRLPRQTGDECFNWYDGWQEGWFRPMLDSSCEIFQVTDNNATINENGRLLNTATGQQPCILHLAGGYCDQVTGKDHVMAPWAKKIGVIE